MSAEVFCEKLFRPTCMVHASWPELFIMERSCLKNYSIVIKIINETTGGASVQARGGQTSSL